MENTVDKELKMRQREEAQKARGVAVGCSKALRPAATPPTIEQQMSKT